MEFIKVTSYRKRMDYFTLLMTALVLQINTELSEALQGNCRLFGCNTVVKFDLHTQTCCGGTVYVKDLDDNGNEKTKCCYGKNSTMYNVETQECCEGKVISKDSSSTGCCQGKLFNKEIDTCCEGKIKNKIHHPCCGDDPVVPVWGVQCCGGKMYDSSKQTCCNGHLWEGIGECCGDAVMNPGEDKCCRHHGEAHKHIGSFETRCCGLNTYRPREQLCCDAVVNDKIDGVTECCGNTTFNITTEVCCQGHVLPREPGKKSCCGGRLYDEDDEVCCRGKVHPGGAAYNSADQLCCQAPGSSFQIVKKGPTHDRCCGLESYDSNSHGCCNSTYLQVYDLENEICNEGGVHPRYGVIETAKPCLQNKLDKDKVCKIGGNNEIPYNSNTSVCTPKGVVALSEGLDICGNKTFRRDLFICCRGKIFTRDVENGTQECCPNPIDQETFIPTKQTCYNGRIVNIPEKHAGSCKGKVYDNRTYECDVTGRVRSIARIEEEPHVCWFNETHFSYFNNNTHTCCDGYVIEATWTCCAEERQKGTPAQLAVGTIFMIQRTVILFAVSPAFTKMRLVFLVVEE
ncbi:Galaxin [Holothuria leucospilota]|uniref:Galaxin n=1 Tax=Holothuria leucospilota TaxID=206669 RepID=A0A9Q1HCJ9_HOLLE|nr:Galaxin [Holothuria leucospilota]